MDFLYYIISMLTMTIEAFAGFGGNAISMPFLALFLNTSDVVVLISFNSLLVNLAVCIFDFRKIVWKVYRRMVLSIAPLLPLGLLAFSALRQYEGILKLTLGIVITAVALWYIYSTIIRKQDVPKPGKVAVASSLVIGAIVQGMFSTGGPILALYTTGQVEDKGNFRATLSAMWFTLNIEVLLIRLFFMDMYHAEVMLTAVKGIPFIAVGLLAGMFLHKRVNNATFKKIVYLILLAAGITSIINGISSLSLL